MVQEDSDWMEKSFTDTVIARGWTKQQRDATSVTGDKAFEFQLNTGRVGIMKAVGQKAAGLRRWPRESPAIASRSLAPRLPEDWGRRCFCVGLRLRLSCSDPLHLQLPLWAPFKWKLQCFLVKRVTTNRKESYECLKPRRKRIWFCFYAVCHSHEEDHFTIW